MADFQGVTYMKLEDDSIFLSLSKSKLYFLKTLLVPKCFLKGFFAQSKKFLKWNINHLWGKKKKKSSYVSVFSQIWISLQLNSFKCFKQVCLTSPRGGYSMETNGWIENKNKNLHLLEDEVLRYPDLKEDSTCCSVWGVNCIVGSRSLKGDRWQLSGISTYTLGVSRTTFTATFDLYALL